MARDLNCGLIRLSSRAPGVVLRNAGPHVTYGPVNRGRWCAHLESVLGTTPREFESRILRHADLRRPAIAAPRLSGVQARLAQFVATNTPDSRPSYQVRDCFRAGGFQ
jgi:hypothetical protein